MQMRCSCFNLKIRAIHCRFCFPRMLVSFPVSLVVYGWHLWSSCRFGCLWLCVFTSRLLFSGSGTLLSRDSSENCITPYGSILATVSKALSSAPPPTLVTGNRGKCMAKSSDLSTTGLSFRIKANFEYLDKINNFRCIAKFQMYCKIVLQTNNANLEKKSINFSPKLV